MKMNTPFFSIIIPVYNGKSHDLTTCLGSIWSQPIDSSLYEVICVDDCSKDDTYAWLQQQAKSHTNLNVIHNKENIRQGGGRNRGVKVASGKYIVFIDQDDYFHKDALEKMYNFLKDKDLEVFISDSAYQYKGHESNKLQLNLKNRECLTGIEFVKANGFVFAPWRMCLLRSFYEAHDFRFPEKCRIEDVDWAMNLFFYTQKMQYQPILVVHYNKAESGTTDNMFRDKDTLIANIQAGNRVMDLANGVYANSEIRDRVIDITDFYYDFSCKCMLGLWCSVNEKREIISLIQAKECHLRWAKLALKYPFLYSAGSNLTVPLFRLLRRIHRARRAKELQ
jgi:glycosyltransferase involved in cell wall biosynthesis